MSQKLNFRLTTTSKNSRPKGHPKIPNLEKFTCPKGHPKIPSLSFG